MMNFLEKTKKLLTKEQMFDITIKVEKFYINNCRFVEKR